jgi:hypothetical protein
MIVYIHCTAVTDRDKFIFLKSKIFYEKFVILKDLDKNQRQMRMNFNCGSEYEAINTQALTEIFMVCVIYYLAIIRHFLISITRDK